MIEQVKTSQIQMEKSLVMKQLNKFRKVDSKIKCRSANTRRPQSSGKQREGQELKPCMNGIYSKTEMDALRYQIKKNPLHDISLIFQREIKKQEAHEVCFTSDQNNFMSRTILRSVSRGSEHRQIQGEYSKGSICQIPLKSQNKNMGAQFTQIGSGRNFTSLKYRLVKYNEQEDLNEFSNIKQNLQHEISNNLSTQKLQYVQSLKTIVPKQKLTSALTSFREFKNSEDINQAISQISKSSALVQQQSHRLPGLSANTDLIEQIIPLNSELPQRSNIRASSSYQEASKQTRDESPWMMNETNKSIIIQQIRDLNRNLQQKKLTDTCTRTEENIQSKNYQLQDGDIKKRNNVESGNYYEVWQKYGYKKTLIHNLSERQSVGFIQENEGNKLQNEKMIFEKQQISSQNNSSKSGMYFNFASGKRLRRAVESERKHFAEFLADKSVHVVLQTRKFDMEPDEEIQKQMDKVRERNIENEKIRLKFTKQESITPKKLKRSISAHLNSQEKINDGSGLNNRSDSAIVFENKDQFEISMLNTESVSEIKTIQVEDLLRLKKEKGELVQKMYDDMKLKTFTSKVNEKMLRIVSDSKDKVVQIFKGWKPKQKNLFIPLNADHSLLKNDQNFQIQTSPYNFQGNFSSANKKKHNQSNKVYDKSRINISSLLNNQQRCSVRKTHSPEQTNFGQTIVKEEQSRSPLRLIRANSNKLITKIPSSKNITNSLIELKESRKTLKSAISAPRFTEYPCELREFGVQKNQNGSTILNQIKNNQELQNLLYPDQRHKELQKEQDQVLLEKYKYLVDSNKITQVNIKKEQRKQKGFSHKIPKKLFDEKGLVYGRNPFLKYKASKQMILRLSVRKYLLKIAHLNLDIFKVIIYVSYFSMKLFLCYGCQIVEKKIFPKTAYERPGAYVFLKLCRNGLSIQIEDMLAENPYHVHDYNELNQTGLHIAAYHDNFEVCLTLLRHFADPDPVDSTGKTPLYYALINKNFLLVKNLFYHRVSPWSKEKVKYGAVTMNKEIKNLFDAARIVHFMLLLPYHYTDKIWDIFLIDHLGDLFQKQMKMKFRFDNLEEGLKHIENER